MVECVRAHMREFVCVSVCVYMHTGACRECFSS